MTLDMEVETFGKSQCSEYYRKYRQDWPQEVIETIVNFLSEKVGMRPGAGLIEHTVNYYDRCTL